MADDVAAILLRFGFAIFAVVVPSAALLSRWVIVVLVPLGAVLIILASLLRTDQRRLTDRAIGQIVSEAGLVCVLLAVWAFASLIWTPAPKDAIEKLFKMIGVVALGFFAVTALPSRMRATNLHLVTIGVALGALLILIASLSAMLGQAVLTFPAATPDRVVVLLTILGWIGAAWMMIKNRPSLAVGLMLLVIAAILFGPTRAGSVPLVVSMLALALAWNNPERAGRWLGWIGAGVILLAPLLAIALHLAGVKFAGPWWAVITADPIRSLTGHGFDASNTARATGLAHASAPVSLISDLWYDLGLLGALFLALAIRFAFLAIGKMGLEVAPSALAALAAATSFALIDRNATQTWWFNGLVVFAIVLTSVDRGRYRTVRPRASLGSGQTDVAPVDPNAGSIPAPRA
ncbi:hypothetical protein MCEMSEM23_03243 [Rhabdaerophilaceae bacterium]